MKSEVDQGVVDARLNVYGVSNLKVADMSISPLNIGANTYSTALLIGERAAMIIAEDLGIDCMDLTRARLR
jgi:alcohol oxidase